MCVDNYVHFFMYLVCVQDRDCFTLIRPVDDESKLQIIDTLPDTAVRPQFRQQMASLRMKIVDDVRILLKYCSGLPCAHAQTG